MLYGSATGLTAAGSQLFTQNTPGVPGTANEGDFFGDALASGDFDNDGVADLAVGAPFEDVTSRQDAGAVSALYGSADGLTTIGSRLFTQVGGTVEAGDWFGFALTTADFNGLGFADLAAAAPNETVGTLLRAGAVSALYGAADGLSANGGQIFTQDTPGVPGVTEDEDLFGNALATGNPGPASPAAASHANPPMSGGHQPR